MNPNVSLASITITTNAIAQRASIVARVCRISLGKDALVTSHNVNGGGMINQSGNAKRSGQRWPSLSLGYNEPNKL